MYMKPPGRMTVCGRASRQDCPGSTRPASWRAKPPGSPQQASRSRPFAQLREPARQIRPSAMVAEHDVTALLELSSTGDRSALDRVFPLVYDQLRAAAHRQLKREPRGHTLSSAALVHEAYFRLVDQTRAPFRGRAHFLALAATAMRRILVDYARGRAAERRGGGQLQQLDLVTIDSLLGEERAEMLVDLDEALGRLATLDPRQEIGRASCREG